MDAATDAGLALVMVRRPSPSKIQEMAPRKTSDARRSRVDLLVRMALIILIIGSVSLVVGVALVAQNLQTPEPRAAVEPGIASETRLMRDDHVQEEPQLTPTTVDSVKAPLQLTTTAPESEPTPPPLVFRDLVHEQCYKERDHGLIDALRMYGREFCGRSDDANLTTVTLYNVPGRFRATLFSSLRLDLSGTRISSPIWSVAVEGGQHDPRFVFAPHMVQCQCPEVEQYAESRRRVVANMYNGLVTVIDPLQIWHPTLAHVNTEMDHPSTICSQQQFTESLQSRNRRWWGNRDARGRIKNPESEPRLVLNITDRVVLIARRDDHNPFFQVSGALNAWIMMKTLDWDPMETQLVHLDDGFPSPIDTLQQKLLAPSRPIIAGKELKDKLVHFKAQVLLPPFESDGPMMLDLDNDNPCFNSSLIQEFRLAALQALNVSSDARLNSTSNSSQPVVVTVISRRPYGGRNVQRMWRNEGEVLAFLREFYANQSIVFRSVECAELSLQQQMQLMVESDVVMGMHGAGLVNVLWTRPETLVLEIFPRQRKRWGYRNLCQNLGCSYHDFRGGIDISTGENDNANDKFIASEEFLAYFEPLLAQHLAGQGRSFVN